MASRRALVITKPGSIALQDAPELVPGPGEVVARPVHTGICIEAAGMVGAVEQALSLARRGGRIRPGPLITHRFPLEAYKEAYQVLRSGSGPRGKVMLDVSAR